MNKCGHNVFDHMCLPFTDLHMQYVLDKFSSFTIEVSKWASGMTKNQLVVFLVTKQKTN